MHWPQFLRNRLCEHPVQTMQLCFIFPWGHPRQSTQR